MSSLSHRPAILLLLGALAACTGTDYIADPPMSFAATVAILPAQAAVTVGDSQPFAATYTDESGATRSDIQIHWQTSDATIAAIGADGVLQALQAGQVQITATAEGISSDAVQVAVVANDSMLAQIVLSPRQVQLTSGASAQLQAVGQTSAGDTLDLSVFDWSSSDTTVAVVDASGQVTARGPGTALIHASSGAVTSATSTVSIAGGQRAGTFVRRPGTTYTVEGGVSLRSADGGGLEVVFADDFVVSAGPRLEVYLSTSQNVFGGVGVGPLQATSGVQSYPLSSAITADQYDWVIIHCVPFNITFGFAQLDSP